jgi:antirestriction protein ArdC
MSDKIYTMITEKIQEELEKGNVPWRKPWAGLEGMPKNMVSKKEYRGINIFLLACQTYVSPYWLTLKQANDLGGKVKKGEKSTPVIFWNWVKKVNEETGKVDKIPFLRYYRVFNLEQCEGIESPDLPIVNNPFSPLEQCETVAKNMPKKPEIVHERQIACYNPVSDKVNMPRPETFDGNSEYYSTLFHELTHSTGHKDRFNRPEMGTSFFGSHDYSKEELTAEMGAAFLCGFCGIETSTIENSAAYIRGWLTKLRSDAKMVIQAAAKAQKAVDYILNRKYQD